MELIRDAKNSFGQILAYRYFIIGACKRELQMQYHRSLLGVLWLILNPLSITLLFNLIIIRAMGAKLPYATDKFSYAIYLCAGLLPWNYFIAVINRNVSLFVEQGGFLKKTVIPAITLPTVSFLTETFNFTLAYSVFLVFLLFIHHFPGKVIFYILPLLVLQQMLAFGIGVLLGFLNVFFRDIGKSMPIILQVWFWLTPIVYSITLLPASVQKLYQILNPMAVIVAGYQQIVLYKQAPPLSGFFGVMFFTVLIFVLAGVTIQRYAIDIVDEL